jgi:hypothetical protein
MHSYAINLKDNISLEHDFEEVNRKNEEAYFQFCQGISLPRYSSLLLANFVSKMHHALPPEPDKYTNESIIKAAF